MGIVILPFPRMLLLALTAWLGYTAATNMPFMPGALFPGESLFWPGVLLMACLALWLAETTDLLLGTRLVAKSAALLAVLTGSLALRLSVLPLAAPATPLAMIGLREALALCALIYAAFAIWLRRKKKSVS